MSWIDGVDSGSGRSSVRLHPEGHLLFRFAGSRMPELDPEWIRQLTESAQSSRGLVVTTEDGRLARSLARDQAHALTAAGRAGDDSQRTARSGRIRAA